MEEMKDASPRPDVESRCGGGRRPVDAPSEGGSAAVSYRAGERLTYTQYEGTSHDVDENKGP